VRGKDDELGFSYELKNNELSTRTGEQP
jgi:hypothetical protein